MSDNTNQYSLGIPESSPGHAESFSEVIAIPSRQALEGLPPSTNLRSGMSAVKDQGPAGTCGAFATAAMVEFVRKGIILAECALMRGVLNRSLSDLFEFARWKGACESKWWPYDSDSSQQTRPCHAPSNFEGKPLYGFDRTFLVFQETSSVILAKLQSADAGGASAPEFGGGFFGPKSDLLRASLSSKRIPAAVEVPVFRSVNGFDGWGWDNGDGRVRIPPGANVAQAIAWANKHDHWHCIAICGYDDAKRLFTFKNSWGEWSAARDGYGTITYDYVDSTARLAMAGQ